MHRVEWKPLKSTYVIEGHNAGRKMFWGFIRFCSEKALFWFETHFVTGMCEDCQTKIVPCTR